MSLDARFYRVEQDVRNRIGLRLPTQLIEVSPTENTWGLGPSDARTATQDDMTGHQTIVLEGGEPDDGTFYHELCHAKVNELGFKQVEIQARNVVDGRRIPSQISILQDILFVVGEAYADCILYTFFQQESSATRSQLLGSFASTGGLGATYRRDGLSAVGQAATFRVCLRWSGDSSHDANLAQMANFAFRREARVLPYYNRVVSTVSTLPPPIRQSSLVQLSDTDIQEISSAVVALVDWRVRI